MLKKSWGWAVPSSGQVWFVKVIIDMQFWVWPSSLHRHLSPIVFSILLLISNFVSIFLLVWLESSYIPKISLLAFLFMDIALKKTLKLGFGRRPQFFLNISSSLVRIKLHTKNQPPNLLNYGDGYEEDFTIRMLKMTSTTFPIFSQYFFLIG